MWDLDPMRWRDRAEEAGAVLSSRLVPVRDVLAATARAAGEVELGLERLLMDPGPPAPWNGRWR